MGQQVRWLVFVALAACMMACVVGAATRKGPPLGGESAGLEPTTPLIATTNEQVVALTRAGHSPAEVIDAIERGGATFDLTVADILGLKKAGVDEEVLKFMLSTPRTTERESPANTGASEDVADETAPGARAPSPPPTPPPSSPLTPTPDQANQKKLERLTSRWRRATKGLSPKTRSCRGVASWICAADSFVATENGETSLPGCKRRLIAITRRDRSQAKACPRLLPAAFSAARRLGGTLSTASDREIASSIVFAATLRLAGDGVLGPLYCEALVETCGGLQKRYRALLRRSGGALAKSTEELDRQLRLESALSVCRRADDSISQLASAGALSGSEGTKLLGTVCRPVLSMVGRFEPH